MSKRPDVPKYFVLCTANLDGSNFSEILKDSKRQMSHVRVSSDHKRVTFTRFNKFNEDGIAIEENGYEETEIMLSRLDGTNLQSVVSPDKKYTNANSYWTPDGNELLYVSTNNPQLKEEKPQIYRYNLKSSQRNIVPVPSHLYPFDPHARGDLMVIPAGTKDIPKNRIWIMNRDGKNARKLSPAGKKGGHEFDPKLSPDKSKVAFMRFKKGMSPIDGVDIIVVDIKTGTEKILSKPGNKNLDAMPEWSSDGKLLIFWHLNFKHINKSGIYTIRPDGTDRRKVPLPEGYYYMMPSFFPGTGSGKDAKIIVAARRFF